MNAGAGAGADLLPRAAVVLVRYDEDIWHERYVLAHVQGTEYIVASPDFDIFVEDVSVGNPDLSGVRFYRHGAGGAVPPPGVAQVHTFGVLSREDRTQLLLEGEELARQERHGRGLAAVHVQGRIEAPGGGLRRPRDVAPVVGNFRPAAPKAKAKAMVAAAPAVHQPAAAAGAQVPAAILPLAAGGGVAAPAPAAPLPRGRAAAGGVWIIDEVVTNMEIGDAVTLPDGAAVCGARALGDIDGETVALRFLPEGTDVDEYAAARIALLSDDSRTMPVPKARTEGMLAALVAEMVEDKAIAMRIQGPRTAAVLLPAAHRPWTRRLPHGQLQLFHPPWAMAATVVVS